MRVLIFCIGVMAAQLAFGQVETWTVADVTLYRSASMAEVENDFSAGTTVYFADFVEDPPISGVEIIADATAWKDGESPDEWVVAVEWTLNAENLIASKDVAFFLDWGNSLVKPSGNFSSFPKEIHYNNDFTVVPDAFNQAQIRVGLLVRIQEGTGNLENHWLQARIDTRDSNDNSELADFAYSGIIQMGGETAPPVATPTPTGTPTATPTATHTPTATPTATTTNTPTLGPSPTATATFSFTPSPTASPTPTLSEQSDLAIVVKDEANEQLLEFPCWRVGEEPDGFVSDVIVRIDGIDYAVGPFGVVTYEKSL